MTDSAAALPAGGPVDNERRTWIAITATASAVGGVCTAVPFVSTFTPSERAKAAGAPVQVDISAIKPGEKLTVEWRGKPVWVLRRTPEMLAQLTKNDAILADPGSASSKQPDYVKGPTRSIKPEVFVAVGVCTHLGCSPTLKKEIGAASDMGADWPGGYYCPCHNSRFDLSARVFKGSPAPTNLDIPPHRYVNDGLVVVGEDTKGA